jgi:hypothetical protein
LIHRDASIGRLGLSLNLGLAIGVAAPPNVSPAIFDNLAEFVIGAGLMDIVTEESPRGRIHRVLDVLQQGRDLAGQLIAPERALARLTKAIAPGSRDRIRLDVTRTDLQAKRDPS